jgi:hypothetical protein
MRGLLICLAALSFWISKEEERVVGRHFNTEKTYFKRASDGKIIRYTFCTSTRVAPPGWKDWVYLGDGKVYKVGKTLQ